MLNELRKLDTVTISEGYDNNVWEITVKLGSNWAGKYNGGYWGDVEITNNELEFVTNYGDVYSDGIDEDEYCFNEGIVQLDYVKGSGLAYTGELEDAIAEAVFEATKGLISCSGSEQGMQGDDYLSLDVWAN